MKKIGAKAALVIDGGPVRFEEIIAVAIDGLPVRISRSRAFLKRMSATEKALMTSLENGVAVYGVNTGYGKSCGNRISLAAAMKNGPNILKFHGCGTGEPIGIEETRAAMLARILCLARGYSGASVGLLEQMAAFLNKGITPVVPCEGSVGASGDLTPMSYIGAALAGRRDVFYEGDVMPAAKAIKKAGLKPYVYRPKEPLSMVNGTTTMTGIAAVCIERSRRILDAVVYATALSVHAMKGNAHHYHPVISEAKPFPGQAAVAREIARLLTSKVSARRLEDDALETLQDPYSLRCAPQALGVLADALSWIIPWVEIEANSSNDNPIFDPATGQVLMGGNFYGGHIAFAMDGLRRRSRPPPICGPPDHAARRRTSTRSAGRPGAEKRRFSRSASRLQGHVDRVVGAGRRGAQSHDARRFFFAVDGIAQPGQGQHGHHRGPGRGARLHACRTGGGHTSAGGGAGLRYPRPRQSPAAAGQSRAQHPAGQRSGDRGPAAGRGH